VSPLRRSRARLLALAVAVFVLVPAASAAACAGADSRPAAAVRYAQAVRCLLNAQRASAGLGPLAGDRKLARAARRFSAAMVRQGFFDHVSPQGSTMDQRIRAAGYPGRTMAWPQSLRALPAVSEQRRFDRSGCRLVRCSRCGAAAGRTAPFHALGTATAVAPPTSALLLLPEGSGDDTS
jgi:hypothetical protein